MQSSPVLRSFPYTMAMEHDRPSPQIGRRNYFGSEKKETRAFTTVPISPAAYRIHECMVLSITDKHNKNNEIVWHEISHRNKLVLGMHVRTYFLVLFIYLSKTIREFYYFWCETMYVWLYVYTSNFSAVNKSAPTMKQSTIDMPLDLRVRPNH